MLWTPKYFQDIKRPIRPCTYVWMNISRKRGPSDSASFLLAMQLNLIEQADMDISKV